MTVVLSEAEWRTRRDTHRARVSRWTEGHRARRAQGRKHPVLDFLFTYYSFRPARLERWHPGPDVILEGADEYLEWSGYMATPDGVTLDPKAFTDARRRTAEFVLALLKATASRSPRLSCFGLHEWAMVYRSSPEEIRHSGWPLRLGHDDTDRVVEGARITCSHFDAFRFFTEPARPLNALQPTREAQIALEQPGCLHANMDLFKYSYKLEPFTPSDLIADCFELAADVRELDMRASPYDLTDLGYQPVRIETPEGRAEFARAQAGFAERAAPLREALINLCQRLLTEPIGRIP